MSIFKTLINKLPVTRTCAQHGYGCNKGCSFVKDGYLDSRPKPVKVKKKK